MLRVDEGGGAAEALGFGHHVQRDGGLARGLRPVDLRDASTRQATHTEGDVERDCAGRDDGDLLEGPPGTEPHDGALAELSIDLREGKVQGLAPVVLCFGHCELSLLLERACPLFSVCWSAYYEARGVGSMSQV